MKTLNLHLQGRWGNQLFQYMFARAYAERNGLELHTDKWVGQQIFEINDPAIIDQRPIFEESKIQDGMEDIGIRGYFQTQKAIDYYTRRKAKEWLQWRPEILALLAPCRNLHWPGYAAHLRRGDYQSLGYPVISMDSYKELAQAIGVPQWRFISEEKHFEITSLPKELAFLPDFYLMTLSKVLARANSSFSWWAATLADDSQEVFSPVIDKAIGGKINDVEWQEGNFCRLASFDFTTNLNLNP